MVLENDPIAFAAWIGPALLAFLQAALILGVAAVVVGYLVATYRYGIVGGGDVTFRMLKRGLIDLVSISPRRIGALARLAVQESLRRRVMIGFALFVLILLFAGWFLDTTTNDPARLYLSFVLNATTYLVLFMALFLSVFSLPADLKNKTIYTVVTKPVRPGEIVLGRIIGFSLVGTMMLAIMGLLSYLFVVRVLNHTHELEAGSLEAAPNATAGERTGRTSIDQNHRHNVRIDSDGRGSTDTVNGHWHEVDQQGTGDTATFTIGPPRDLFMARVPRYGELTFRDRAGKAVSRGISVGDEWKYRSFIEGATLASAIWKFQDVTPERFPKGLPVELTITVFRSHKGNIEEGIRGSLTLRNPRTGLESALRTFTAKDASIDSIRFAQGLSDSKGNPIDLFKDLVDDGELEIHLQCLDSGQYFGVAKADVYLRARDGSFTENFIKGYVGIWARMLLVVSFGVMFSTFLSGPVALLATLTVLIIGSYTGFVQGVAQGTIEGGGPVESLIRTVQQRNVTTELDPGLTRDVVKAVDGAFMYVMTAATHWLPDFRKFNNASYVAYGFDIPPDTVLIQLCTALGYVAAMFAIGYFFLRTREVAR